MIPVRQYKCFRLDRSDKSHPPDPNNPKKFRRNGGGVLIAIRDDLDVKCSEIKLKAAAEILAVQLTLGNGNKFIFSTCYRVGTLGLSNHESVIESYRPLLTKAKPPKFFLIGDFNLSKTDWDLGKSPDPVEQAFIDSFAELGLRQHIKVPTHTKGNILDILLTNFDNIIANVKVKDHLSVCYSDHFPITFSVLGRVKRISLPKREFYNFKKADWDSLNADLQKIKWNEVFLDKNVLECWQIFKSNIGLNFAIEEGKWVIFMVISCWQMALKRKCR